MGAYLSAPVTDKISADNTTEILRYGASSMQGWRISQEDAHNCCPDFDPEDKTSLFAVYDGHGGAEVAQYTGMHLPDFIKSVKAYKEAKLSQALEDAFMGFDETLTREKVIQELKELAGVTIDEDEDEETRENEVADLCEEATMPMAQLLEKYGRPKDAKGVRQLRKQEDVQSPMIRPKQDNAFSKMDGANVENKPDSGSEENGDPIKTKLESKLVNGHSDNENNENIEKDKGVSRTDEGDSSEKKEESKQCIEDKNSNLTESADKLITKEISQEKTVKDSSSSQLAAGDSSSNTTVKNEGGKVDGDGAGDAQSSSSTSAQEGKEEVGGSSQSGSAAATQEGDPQPGSSSGRTRKPRKTVIPGEDEDESSYSGSESEEEEEEDWGSDSEEDEEEQPDSDEEEGGDGRWRGQSDDLDEEEEKEIMTGGEEPGADSGCTAVAALLRGSELYVANAGDSRCIVSRNGKAFDMSVDHKPEDDLEKARIYKAGGRVTPDGRVNGGLNLSRALGDHCYKQNEDLSAKEQMITALPDIRSITLEETDEFMVLACDGIWNVMSSQDVVNFVKERLQNGTDIKLSSICEEMFDFCLASDTTGDGTGCDNMTCIIVTFDKLHASLGSGATSTKRRASNGHCDTPETKKPKDDNTSTDTPVEAKESQDS